MVRHISQERRKSAAVAILAVGALALSACGGGSSDTAPAAEETAAAAPAADPNAIKRTLVGMHIEGVEGGAWASAPFGALRLWDNGTGWSQIELAKGDFKWDNLEGALTNAESKGMTDILFVLGTTPEWAATKVNESDYPQPGAASAPANLEDWDAWVTAVVEKFGSRINAYQIWNEANLKNFYNGTPKQMAEMTKRAYDIIKANDPDALVVSASPSTRLASAFDRFFPEYLKELKTLNWPIDVVAIHTYPDGAGDPVARGVLIEKAQAALTAAGAPDLPLWDTEFNYGLAGPGEIPRTEITGPRAAGFVVRTYIDDLRYGIDRSYWYIWTLREYDLLGIQAYSGTDAEQGFFAIDNWVTGASFGGCTENAGAVTCDFSRDGTSWIVAWAQTGEVPYTTPENSQLVCDPLSACQEAGPGTQITLTEIPVRVYLQ
jgi:GH35 family endo-1,4-beta-xylanase